VVQLGDGPGLLLEAPQPLGIGGEGLGQELDGDVPAQAGVRGAEDLAHGALAQEVLDAVGAEFLASLDGHGGDFPRQWVMKPLYRNRRPYLNRKVAAKENVFTLRVSNPVCAKLVVL